ncbi:MAG: radical SAM protein, partial [Spirochaetota bacterium]
MNRILPEKELKTELLSVEKPGRYVGGEVGSIHNENAFYNIAVSFPDLYEIGMSNLAIRILYNMFNRIEHVNCERVFAPALDFEKVLRAKKIPLFTLETGIPLHECDLVAFSISYELTITNVLNILDLGHIPVKSSERLRSDPIIIAGGPGIVNPYPFGDFLDAVYIGEAEESIEEIIISLVNMKKKEVPRNEMILKLFENKHIWHPDKKETTKRAVWMGFGKFDPSLPFLPVSTLKAVQDHGIVEIMRGCPNGCRFCNAGV